MPRTSHLESGMLNRRRVSCVRLIFPLTLPPKRRMETGAANRRLSCLLATPRQMVPAGEITMDAGLPLGRENMKRELFGFERTREISVKSAQEIAEAAKAWGQNDDITVVTVRRNEEK